MDQKKMIRSKQIKFVCISFPTQIPGNVKGSSESVRALEYADFS